MKIVDYGISSIAAAVYIGVAESQLIISSSLLISSSNWKVIKNPQILFRK